MITGVFCVIYLIVGFFWSLVLGPRLEDRSTQTHGDEGKFSESDAALTTLLFVFAWPIFFPWGLCVTRNQRPVSFIRKFRG